MKINSKAKLRRSWNLNGTDLNFLSEGSHDARNAGVQTEGLFDAALEVLHTGHVLRCARLFGILEDVVHLFEEQLLLLRMPSDAIEEPTHGRGCRIVALKKQPNVTNNFFRVQHSFRQPTANMKVSTSSRMSSSLSLVPLADASMSRSKKANLRPVINQSPVKRR